MVQEARASALAFSNLATSFSIFSFCSPSGGGGGGTEAGNGGIPTLARLQSSKHTQ